MVKESTDCYAAAGRPLGRLVFSRTGSPPAVDGTSRTLTTGRAVRADVAAQPRTEEELLTSWADMQTADYRAVATGPISRGDAR